MKADYPLRFINSVVNEFQKGWKFYNSTVFIWNYKTFHIRWNTLLWTEWN